MKKDSAFKLKSGNKPSIAKLMGGSVIGGIKTELIKKKAKDKYREYVKKSNKDPEKYPPVSSDKFRKSMLKKKIDIKIDKKGIKTKVNKTVTYKDAYNRMSQKQKSKFKDFADFESQAKSYNRKKYGTINPTATARKQGISKSELAKKNKAMSKKAPKIALKPVKNSRGQNIYVQNNFVGKKAKKV